MVKHTGMMSPSSMKARSGPASSSASSLELAIGSQSAWAAFFRRTKIRLVEAFRRRNSLLYCGKAATASLGCASKSARTLSTKWDSTGLAESSSMMSSQDQFRPRDALAESTGLREATEPRAFLVDGSGAHSVSDVTSRAGTPFTTVPSVQPSRARQVAALPG